MEYIYAALLLHSAKKEINEENLKKVLEAAGVSVDEARVKSLVESVKNINIDEVLSSATLVTAPVQPVATQQQAAEKKEEKKSEEESKKAEEQAVAGLSALFGF